MYAIIETGGKQYKVIKGDIIEVEKLTAQDNVSFDKVLFISNDSNISTGKPYISGASVLAKILCQGKDPKVTTFKYKNKTNYHRTKGHRQPYTRVQIEEINHGA